MSNCQIKKGIFVLKECGEIAAVKCADCNKFVCGKHGKQDGAKLVCPECYAKSHQNELSPAGRNKLYQQWENGSVTNYMLWYFVTRHSFYSTSHYHPFDSHDYDSFNKGSDVEFADEQTTGHVFDS